MKWLLFLILILAIAGCNTASPLAKACHDKVQFYVVSSLYGEGDICYDERGTLDFMIVNNGEMKRDFTYIDDLLQGILLSLFNSNAYNQIFNITFGSARSLKQMAEIVMSHFPGIELEFKPRDELMPERGTLSIAKAQQLLGYQPNHELDSGFESYIRWYKKLAEDRPQLFNS